MSRVSDGATLRHSRIIDLLRYIQDELGASTEAIQRHMLSFHGLKFKTSSEYLSELAGAGFVRMERDGLWHTTDRVIEFFGTKKEARTGRTEQTHLEDVERQRDAGKQSEGPLLPKKRRPSYSMPKGESG